MQILVEYGKHDTRYHDASTLEALDASALAILTDRWNAGYYYHDPGPKPEWDGPNQQERDTIKEIDEDAWQTVIKKWRRYVSALARWKADKEEYESIQYAIEHKDGALAWAALYNRSDYEYERVELETVESHEDNRD
jgi:hypothetical protein